jgi:hypothetical protein
VRDAGLIKNRTDTAKSRGFVETDDGDLRVQINFSSSLLFCGCNRATQQLLTDLFSPLTFENRHAADLGIVPAHDQPRRSHGSFFIAGDKMNRSLIVGIQLDFCGHTLLSDKHTNPNSQGLLQFPLGGNLFDCNSWFHCDMHE